MMNVCRSLNIECAGSPSLDFTVPYSLTFSSAANSGSHLGITMPDKVMLPRWVILPRLKLIFNRVNIWIITEAFKI